MDIADILPKICSSYEIGYYPNKYVNYINSYEQHDSTDVLNVNLNQYKLDKIEKLMKSNTEDLDIINEKEEMIPRLMINDLLSKEEKEILKAEINKKLKSF